MENKILENAGNYGLRKTQEISREQIDLWKRTYCKGATDDELQLFVSTCSRTGLSPEAKQIYAIKRWDSNEKKMIMALQTSIDGYRLVAERTGQRGGDEGPYWLTKDREWVDFWIDDYPPLAAKYKVYKKGIEKPYTGIAKYSSFVQTKKDGSPTQFWVKMPEHMLAKIAETQAIKKAFPMELSGLYTEEEMQTTNEMLQIHDEPERVSNEDIVFLFKKCQDVGMELGNLKDYLSNEFNITQTKFMNKQQFLQTMGWLDEKRISNPAEIINAETS